MAEIEPRFPHTDKKRKGNLLFPTLVIALLGTINQVDLHPNIPVDQNPSPKTQALIEKLERIQGEKTVYSLKDSEGIGMDCAKIIHTDKGLLAVYHAKINGKFEGRIALSEDKTNWNFVKTLDTDASQLTVFATENGGYVVGLEKNVYLNGRDNGSNLEFKYYESLENLLLSKADRELLLPRTQSEWNEGTPNIFKITFEDSKNPDITKSTIEVGFHYNDVSRYIDRQARGVIKNFSSWESYKDTFINDFFEKKGMLDVGDRDYFTHNGSSYIIYEARETKDFADWKSFLFDETNKTLTFINFETDNKSKAFSNPSVTVFENELIVGSFIPHEGSKGKEAGEVIYYPPR